LQLQDSVPKRAVYYPNTIGQPAPSASKTFALLVEGKDDRGGVQLLIMNSLLRRGARILSQNGRIYDKTGDFTLCLICDLRDLSETSDDVVIEVRKMKSVKHAQGVSLKNNMFDGLLFPLALMDTDRVVAINSSLTFEIQQKLRTQVDKSSFIEAAVDYGKSIVSRIQQKFGERRDNSPAPTIQVIQDNVRGYMMATGWGRFDWQSEENIERVLIHDPPTVTIGGSGEGNLFLQGMVAGMMESFRSKKYSIIEDHYDATARLLTLAYVEQSLVKPVENQSREQLVSVEQKVKVLEEIEKIIDAVEGKPPEAKKEEPQVIEQVVKAPSDSGARVQVALKRKSKVPTPSPEKPSEEKKDPKIETKPEPVKNEKPSAPVQVPESPQQKQEGAKAEPAAGAESVLILASEKERQLKEAPKEPQPKEAPQPKVEKKEEKEEQEDTLTKDKKWKSVAKNPPGYVDEFTISDEVNDETLWL
jgi:hypothetical protein